MPVHRGTQTIETRRLMLRKAAVSDADAMYANWASDSDVTRFLTWPPHNDVEVTKQVLQDWVSNYEKAHFYQWMIVLKELGEPIGTISGMNPDDRLSSVELGYCIGKQWWHQGIVSEAVEAVLQYFFIDCNFNRIVARHDVNNPNSGAVMKTCGMRYEGTSRQSACNNQGICDMAQYAILSCDRSCEER